MFERFTDGARRVVVQAQEEARLLDHDHIGTEHLLLGLIHDGHGSAAGALSSLGISLEAVRSQVEGVVGRGSRPPTGQISFTARAKKVLELSLREAIQLGHDHIGTEHILLGLIREDEGVAAEVLTELGADLGRVREHVLALAGGGAAEPMPIRTESRRDPAVGVSLAPSRDACSFCGRDLWDVARHVASTSARICDECVAASHRAIEEAAAQGLPAHEPLRLPPRVSGPQPSDDAAVRAVAQAFTMAFGGAVTDEERARYVEDGASLAPLLSQAGAPYPRSSGAIVQRVRFVEPDRAQVRFAILLGYSEIPLEGEAVQRDGRWRVSRTTVCQLLSMAGIAPPPDPAG